MKKIIAISLAALMLAISIKDLAIYALFKANQDYLAENVCINRFSPDELCKATCIFTQTIVDSQKQQEKFPTSSLEKQPQIVFSIFPTLEKNIGITHLPKIVPTKRFSFLSTSFLTDVFHPPEC